MEFDYRGVHIKIAPSVIGILVVGLFSLFLVWGDSVRSEQLVDAAVGRVLETGLGDPSEVGR